jgi:hypothetical protein
MTGLIPLDPKRDQRPGYNPLVQKPAPPPKLTVVKVIQPSKETKIDRWIDYLLRKTS